MLAEVKLTLADRLQSLNSHHVSSEQRAGFVEIDASKVLLGAGADGPSAALLAREPNEVMCRIGFCQLS